MKAQVWKEMVADLDPLYKCDGIKDLTIMALHDSAKELLDTMNRELLGVLLIEDEEQNLESIIEKEITEGESHIPECVYQNLADMLERRADRYIDMADKIRNAKVSNDERLDIVYDRANKLYSECDVAHFRSRIDIDAFDNKYFGGKCKTYDDFDKAIRNLVEKLRTYAQSLQTKGSMSY